MDSQGKWTGLLLPASHSTDEIPAGKNTAEITGNYVTMNFTLDPNLVALAVPYRIDIPAALDFIAHAVTACIMALESWRKTAKPGFGCYSQIRRLRLSGSLRQESEQGGLF